MTPQPALQVTMPPGWQPERHYAAAVLLRDWLGVATDFMAGSEPVWQLRVPGHAATMTLADAWGPEQPGQTLPLATVLVPAAGTDTAFDPFAAVFRLLSGQDETGSVVRDRHQRFPLAAAPLAELLQRPLADEAAQWLRDRIDARWPGLVPPLVPGRVLLSCDVDLPFSPEARRPFKLLGRLGGDLLRRRSWSAAAARLANVRRVRAGDWLDDPLYRFDTLMDIAERAGIRCRFFFIAGRSGGAIDGCYDILEPGIRTLLQHIHARGHDVGLHGSYHSFRDPVLLRGERERLQEACSRAGFTADTGHNRQHFLRWDVAATPAALAAAGCHTDWTLGFAEQPGFRCGTGRRFPLWSWPDRRALPVLEQPLHVMETTLFDHHYLGRQPESALLQELLVLRRAALAGGGDFSVLWHNSGLPTPAHERFLAALISGSGDC